MISLFNKYKSAVGNMHGWKVALTCKQCKVNGLPRYEGWASDLTTAEGSRPVIYAKLACPQCGSRLTAEAGQKLAELFKKVPLLEENERIIKGFIAGLILVPAALALLLLAGAWTGWWRYSAFALLALSAVVIPLLVMNKNYRIALLRSRCLCGHADYIFMGFLDGTSCYRCSSCERLLRLRD